MSSAPLSPSYYGYVGSTKDALHIIQAAVNKQVDLILRRPHERERPGLIRSGNVFVFIEEHLGIKRWTDGIAWLPSRILGRFLVYRELDKQLLAESDDKKKKKRKVLFTQDPLEKHHIGHADTGYGFKDQGLIKKTLSLSTVAKDLHVDRRAEKQTIHLILYYNADDVLNGKLQRPSELALKGMPIHSGLWDAIKELLLGGKIPIEDEAYYFLDNNYQLQNMLVLQAHHRPPPPVLHAKEERVDEQQHHYVPHEPAFINPFTPGSHATVAYNYQQYVPQDGFAPPPPPPGPGSQTLPHFAPYPPQHFQQVFQQQHPPFGLILASSDQFLVSGASNGLVSSVGSGAVHTGSIGLSNTSLSGPALVHKYRNSSGGSGNWFQTGSGAGYVSRLPALPHEAQDFQHHLPAPEDGVAQLYVTGANYNGG